MTATTTSKIPEHIQRAMREADSLTGWNVVCGPKSVTITPPPANNGNRRRSISFPLVNPRTPDQVRMQLDRAGMYSALKKLEADTPVALPEPEPEHVMAEAKTKADLPICPECERSFKSPAGWGTHRLKAHGVAGTSKATANRNRQRAAARGVPEEAAAVAVVKETVPAARKPVEDPKPTSVPAPAVAAAEPAKTHRTPSIRKAIDDFLDTVTQSVAPLHKKIEEQDKAIAELQSFKDQVASEIANGHQAPIQTLANIIKLGGEGFGTPKA